MEVGCDCVRDKGTACVTMGSGCGQDSGGRAWERGYKHCLPPLLRVAGAFLGVAALFSGFFTEMVMMVVFASSYACWRVSGCRLSLPESMLLRRVSSMQQVYTHRHLLNTLTTLISLVDMT